MDLRPWLLHVVPLALEPVPELAIDYRLCCRFFIFETNRNKVAVCKTLNPHPQNLWFTL